MKTAIIATKLNGFTVTIDGVTKLNKGGIMKQMSKILELSSDGYRVTDQAGKQLNMC